MLQPDTEFSPSQLLATKDNLVRLVRFLAATRHLTGILRAIDSLEKTGNAADEEAVQVLTLHLVGAAKEAADGFRDCDSNGQFGMANRLKKSGKQLRKELKVARKHVNKTDPSSLYNRILKPFRDDVSFHVQRKAVLEALTALWEERFKAFILDSETRVLALPLVRAVMVEASWGSTTRDESLSSSAEEVLQFQAALRNIANDHFLVLVHLSIHGARSSQ